MTDGLEVAERALAAAEGDEAQVLVHTERSGLARFAGDEVHQPTLIENASATLLVVRDGRVGSATTNRLSDEGLAELARRAAEAADGATVDPDYPGLAPPAPFPDAEGWDEETASLSPAELARLARAALDACRGGAYGYFTTGATTLALAASNGARGEQRLTDASVLVLAAGDGASGYADATAWAASAIDPARTAEEAAEKAARTRGAARLEPGSYAAVLEPYAVAELLDYFAFDAFNGLALLEERSFFTGRLGERVFDERVSIADDPLDPRGLPRRFDPEGTPKRRTVLVEDGVARDVVWDRATAARAGRESTGHALPTEQRRWGAYASSLSVAGGDAESTAELAERIGDGVYVTRLHYLGVVEPREGVVTGMTRDGTFRVRDGKVAEPLVNLRFTVAVPEVLADVPGLTRDVKLVTRSDFYDERDPVAALVPALATARFAVTGVGSGPGL